MEDRRFFDLSEIQQKLQLQKILNCNKFTKSFGICLSNEEALSLLQSRKESLKEQQRVEFGESILEKLIFAFCDSPYIYQDNYSDTIERLLDIFYLYKNESMDEYNDDELLEIMKNYFDGICQGDLEYLEGTCLEIVGRNARRNYKGYLGGSEDED